jgi:hypothetical protein
MPLTNTAIRKIKPGQKSLKLFDGGGLYLEVAPAGGKWWRLKYRFNGETAVAGRLSGCESEGS